MFSLKEGYIETFTGRKFHPDDPEFAIVDIAHSTGNLCRFNGHCHRFYSVAEHSVLTAHLVYGHLGGTREDAFEALMHDAVEAYVSDIPTPYKQYCPGAVKLESDLEEKLRAYYQVPTEKSDICKKADMLALFIEADSLMHSRGEVFSDKMGLKEEAAKLMLYPVVGYMPKDASKLFLHTFHRLAPNPPL